LTILLVYSFLGSTWKRVNEGKIGEMCDRASDLYPEMHFPICTA